MTTMEDLVGALTINQFCEKYSVGRTKTYELIKARDLRAVKIGSGTRILKSDAERWAMALPALTASSV
jgi:excisionase family DNA binding protein